MRMVYDGMKFWIGLGLDSFLLVHIYWVFLFLRQQRLGTWVLEFVGHNLSMQTVLYVCLVISVGFRNV